MESQAMRQKPSPEEVKKFFEYDKDTGDILHKGTLYNATISSKRSHSTYKQVYAAGVLVPATHIAFVLVTGRWPDKFIDHIDGDGENNKWSNLREAERWQNMANQRLNIKNSSGYKGVHMSHGKWQARIQVQGKRMHLGYFATKEEASGAYIAAAKAYFGEFFRESAVSQMTDSQSRDAGIEPRQPGRRPKGEG